MRSFHLPGRSTVHARGGMCATSHPLAALNAIEVLRRGGNAVDAAVTASAVLCVAEPHMTGIGGDCFAMIAKADGTVIGLNASGRAARAADADWLARSGLTEIDYFSIHAVTVPGAVDGWARLLAAHGTIGLAEALAPAITLAEDGVVVSPRVGNDWALKADIPARDEGGRMHLLRDGKAPRVGQVYAFPALARTLKVMAAQGPDAFYRGELAEDMVACLQAKGSLLTMDDFAATEATWVEPIRTSYGGADVLEIPPSGQGITALIILNILKHFDHSDLDPMGPERFHILIEATRLAYEMRDRHVADPDMAAVPVDRMLSADLAATLAARIDPDRCLTDLAAAVDRHHSDTVYLTVVDEDRTAVSFINSLYRSFGVGIVTPKTGITLHDRGACFVAKPGHPNCIGPGKRPLHTIIPAMMMRDGRAAMPFGVMGGAYQAMGHAHLVSNLLDYGLDIQEALDCPRAFYEKAQLEIEEGLPAATVAGLKDRGHDMIPAESPLGGGQAIMIDWEEGTLTGGSDPRKDGMALGY
jgi:gamma-glutamyltranspeptidase/glutathione hydrolase